MKNDDRIAAAKDFWDRVDELKIKRGLTYEDIAEAIGTTRGYIYVCRTRLTMFSYPRVVEIAKVLGSTPEYLLTGDGIKLVDKESLSKIESEILTKMRDDKLFRLIVYKMRDFERKELSKVSFFLDEIVASR